MAKKVAKAKRSIEPIPTTTMPYVTANHTVAPTTPAVTFTDTKAKASFYAFMTVIGQEDVKTHFPTAAAYYQFRNETGFSTRGLDTQAHDAIAEYDNAWDGIQNLLENLWDKYLGDKFGSQDAANFVFKLLLKGAEKGWEAVKNFVRRELGDEAVANTETVVNALNDLVSEDGLNSVKADIQAIHDQLNKPVETGKKANFWQKALRFLRIVVTFGRSK